MRMKHILFYFLVLQLISSCDSKNTNPKERNPQSYLDLPEDSLFYDSRYSVIYAEGSAKNIRVKDNRTHQIIDRYYLRDAYKFISMDTVYHNAVYFPNSLYIPIKKSHSEFVSTYEIWNLTPTKSKKMLQCTSSYYKVHHNQNYIAYFDRNYQSYFIIHNLKTNQKRNISFKRDSYYAYLTPLDWAIKKNEIWGNTYTDYYFHFKYNVDSNQLTLYKDPVSNNYSSEIKAERSINPDKGLLLYSDYPDDKMDGSPSKPGFLYLYDFNSHIKSKICTNNGIEQFKPKWLTPNTFEYYDPSLKRVVQKKI